MAVAGNIAYGALVMGAYGFGLAASIALSGLVLRPASHAARFNTWLASRREAFHLVQGVIFAAVGGLTISFFWLRYIIPPA